MPILLCTTFCAKFPEDWHLGILLFLKYQKKYWKVKKLNGITRKFLFNISGLIAHDLFLFSWIRLQSWNRESKKMLSVYLLLHQNQPVFASYMLLFSIFLSTFTEVEFLLFAFVKTHYDRVISQLKVIVSLSLD